MNCACGAVVEPGPCPACDRHNLTCPSCGGGISAASGAVVVSCPYCDTPLKHQSLSARPPFFPVNLDPVQARKRLKKFLLSRFGIPDDFETRCRVTRCEQVFVPVHLFTVTARLTDSISETDTHAVVGTRDLWYHDAIAGYRFAVRVKQLMDPEQLRARIYPLQVDAAQATQQAKAYGRELLKRDQKRFSEVAGRPSIQCDPSGQVFYPLYELEYRYSGRIYRGVVDAASGVVCLSDHPMSLQSRALVMAAGAGLMLFTVGVSVLFALIGLAKPAILPAGLLTLLTGALASARIFWTAMRSHSSGQAISADHHPLDVPSLDSTLAVPARKQLSAR